MERNEQLHEEAEETLDQINKKTGRNMPQAIATGAALVILIVACLLLSVDLFVLLVVVFMILALWELRVDFATVGLHLPVFMLWLCSSFTLIATYYSPYHLITMSLSIIGRGTASFPAQPCGCVRAYRVVYSVVGQLRHHLTDF